LCSLSASLSGLIAAAFFVNATFKAPKIQQAFKALVCIGGICPYIIICALRIDQLWWYLTVMDIVLVAVVVDTILLNPACIQASEPLARPADPGRTSWHSLATATSPVLEYRPVVR